MNENNNDSINLKEKKDLNNSNSNKITDKNAINDEINGQNDDNIISDFGQYLQLLLQLKSLSNDNDNINELNNTEDSKEFYNKNISFRCYYDIEDYDDTQIINNGNGRNFNDEIE